MSLTPKENYLNAINHKPTEWTPIFPIDCAGSGFGAYPGPWFEKGPMGGGYDGFGIRWITPASGGGAPIPAPNEHIMDSETIVDWKSIVKFPDLETVDWPTMAAEELKLLHNFDRDQTALEFGCGNGVFERVAALMGFEETLMALIEEPEACYELMEAITDYKIEFAKKVKQYYNPDIFNNYDDIATERGLFMSPDVYRKLIKPHHKRLNDAVKELGMIPIQHTCGLCESLIEDIIETGAAAWTSVQPVNDIVKLLEKYGDRIALIGGYDANGIPGRLDATVEERLADVHRCLDTYGKYPSYIIFPFVTVNSLDPKDMLDVMMPMLGEAIRYSHELGRTQSV
ncbi:uroporphyrinogen decarboxylase family protein [Acetobacterium wieringae]|uniref:Methylcobalamin:coenzyme M methyltransferase n=1 Tax=Acetobacterium wieringae TaxID=52694 RepID=A0A1F2PED9_9FIRM|nr:uroporphyrinogen decarboxylase family protein [Acetobacterium wieringae]OFV69232.1 methylcobalamin:coenzyme M methyltransferase [Acetobacterium wieringae]